MTPLSPWAASFCSIALTTTLQHEPEAPRIPMNGLVCSRVAQLLPRCLQSLLRGAHGEMLGEVNGWGGTSYFISDWGARRQLSRLSLTPLLLCAEGLRQGLLLFLWCRYAVLF